MQENIPINKSNSHLWENVRNTLYVLGMLVLFLFALDLMVSSLQHLGKSVAETIITATANPFTGLFIGLLITAMIQSSSTTTSIVVALVASGSITLQSAIPIIMGANVGTTITSTIVALGFINKRKEFKRAVAAGTYHDFFNVLTVIILFPLEYYYGFLSFTASHITQYLFQPSLHPIENNITHFWWGFNPIINFLVDKISNKFILVLFSVILLFTSIILFRKLISRLLQANSPERFSKFFFKNHFKSFFWGLGTTAAIRSSTITTSLVVPLVAQRVVKLREAVPFILGANIGTTITAFIAVTLNSNTTSAMSIAIVHFLFNFFGVLIFYPISFLREIPIKLATGLGRLTLKYRLAGFVYILIMFFFIPFTLIYFNQESIQTLEITYERTDSSKVKHFYTIISKMNVSTKNGEWIYYDKANAPTENLRYIYPVSLKNNILFAQEEMYLFNKPGFCWDGENKKSRFKSCIIEVTPTLELAKNLSFDSIYTYRQTSYDSMDTLITQTYVSARYLIIVKKETLSSANEIISSEKIINFIEK